MRMYDLIMKKRSGGMLERDEIFEMIRLYTAGEIPDYQMSALMMAIWFNGMNDEETLNLTMAMAESGEMLDLSGISGIKVDKHSTGGVGDKTTMALAPIVSSLGVPVAKMSGRGLGHTGGTIDKLESFPGFHTDISLDTFIQNVNVDRIAIMGQTKELAPADKKLYALRDVTATVDNMSLIASSIMSKKLSAGADGIVLDVKTGSGAFMKTYEDSVKLAEEMVRIGTGAGRRMNAVISDMDQPLGNAVGNILEVKEAIATLMGEGPEDFVTLCRTLASRMLLIGDKAGSEEEAFAMFDDSVKSGKGLDKLALLVRSQGGDDSYVYHPEKFEEAGIIEEIPSECEGYVKNINCSEIGVCSLILGGGRETKEDVIDLKVGLVLHKKKGDFVKKGESLATIHASDKEKLKVAKKRFLEAYTFTDVPVVKEPVIRKIIRGTDI